MDDIPLTLLEPQSRFGDKSVKFQVFCHKNGTAVLKGLKRFTTCTSDTATVAHSRMVLLAMGCIHKHRNKYSAVGTESRKHSNVMLRERPPISEDTKT